MRTTLKWSGVILAATVADLLARFVGSFDLTRILWAEALIFPAAGMALIAILKRSPRLSGFKRSLQVLIIASFFLAGLRSGLWASGVPVDKANMGVLLVAVLVWLWFRIRRGRSGNP